MRFIPITSLFALTLFLGGCWHGAVQPPAPPSNGPVTPSDGKVISISTTSIDISDWQTYTNEEYGFEFRYPKDYLISTINTFSIYFKNEATNKDFKIEYFTPESWKSFVESAEYVGFFPENRWAEENNFYNSFFRDQSSYSHYKAFVTPKKIRFIKSGGYYPPGGNYVIRYHTVVGKLNFLLYSYDFDYEHETLPSGDVTNENDLVRIESAILNKQMTQKTNNEWLSTLESIIYSFGHKTMQ